MTEGGPGRADAASGDAGPDAGPHDGGPDVGETDSGGEGGSTPGCDTCDPVADCDTTGDAPRCLCPDSHEGDGVTCTPKCDSAGCDPQAECSVVEGEAQCDCVGPYLGDGESCEFDGACALLTCDAHAACEVDGAMRRCRCLPGYQGDGTTCTNEDDCDPNPCGLGTCTDLVLDFACECPDGYSGKRCQNDACEDDPCEKGLDCVRVPEGRMCQPSCAPNCDAGDPCTKDADCEGSMFCHADGVCLKPTCTGGTIDTLEKLEALRYCQVITGGISIDNSDGGPPAYLFPEGTNLELPYCEVLSGRLLIVQQPFPKVRLPVLKEAGGISVLLYGVDASRNHVDLRAPALSTLSGPLGLGHMRGQIQLDALATIGGDLTISWANLEPLDIGEVNVVHGDVTVEYTTNTPWSAVSHLQSLGQSQTFKAIGCNLCPDSKRYACDGLGYPACP